MAGEAEQPTGRGLGAERRVDVGRRRAERDVHVRAAVGAHHAGEQRRAIQLVIEELRLGGVARAHRRQPAQLLHPRQHLGDDVDAEGGRRVVHRAVVREGAVRQHGRQVAGAARDQVLLHDHQRHARRTEVLLGAGVDERVAPHVDRPREDVARRVADQRHAGGHLGLGAPLRAVDRVVAREVRVGRRRGPRGVGGGRDVREARGLAGARDVDRAEAPGLGDRFLRPHAGAGVVRRAAAEEVHRHQEELRRRTAGHEQHVVVVGHRRQLAHQRLGAREHRHELGAAVAVLKHADAATVEIPQRRLRPSQHGLRQDRRPGRKVPAAAPAHVAHRARRATCGRRRSRTA